MASNVGKDRKGPDWNRIRAEYLKGGTSYRELASKHGVPLGTLKTRAQKHKWGDGKSETHVEVMSRIPAVVAGIVLDQAAQATRSHLDDLEAARQLARGLLASVDNPQALKDWATAYKSIQAGQRLALNLESTPKGGFSEPSPSSPDAGPPADELTAIAQYRDALG